ncbi:MAG: ribbon-helix-helix protein, CopG family [bacterium]|nr:ribbon-helix-helix protein, CopG family [bacterium]
MAKINVSLPDEIIARLDEDARRHGLTRSEYIRRSVELYARYLHLEAKVEEKIQTMKGAITEQDTLAERMAEYVA